MPKYRDITNLLKSRIRLGDYKIRTFPSTARLAAELEIDPRTATKAVQELVSHGLLIKTETGRVALASHRKATKHVAMLCPAFSTPTIAGRFAAIERLCEARGWDIRMVSYNHDHDPAIFDAIDGFDGLFMAPLNDQFTPDIIAKLRASGTKAVVLFEDHSQYGIPTLRFENPGNVALLLNHLHELGHRCVACINTQPQGQIMQQRIEAWQAWKAIHKASGPLIDEPVEHFADPLPAARAVIGRCLKQGGLEKADAIFCTTGAAAIGVMRGMADFGLTPGREIAVCAFDSHGSIGEHFIPSLTFPLSPVEDPYFEMCLDWFASERARWNHPLVLEALDTELFIGESTSPRRQGDPRTGVVQIK